MRLVDKAVGIALIAKYDMKAKRIEAYRKHFDVATTVSVWKQGRLQCLVMSWLEGRRILARRPSRGRPLGVLGAPCVLRHPSPSACILALSRLLSPTPRENPSHDTLHVFRFRAAGNLTGLLGALTETEREMISVERMDEYCREAADTPRSDGQADNVGGECLNNDGDDDNDKDCDNSTTAINNDNQADATEFRTNNDPRNSRLRLRTRERAGMVSSDWPSEGRLEVCDLVMRYRRGLSPSLKGVSLTVGAGEKVRATSTTRRVLVASRPWGEPRLIDLQEAGSRSPDVFCSFRTHLSITSRKGLTQKP